jgi:hypothetical protein
VNSDVNDRMAREDRSHGEQTRGAVVANFRLIYSVRLSLITNSRCFDLFDVTNSNEYLSSIVSTNILVRKCWARDSALTVRVKVILLNPAPSGFLPW